MNRKYPLSHNQKRILKLMRDKDLIIIRHEDHKAQNSENLLVSRDRADIFERVPTIVLNSLSNRNLFKEISREPAMDVTTIIFSLKRTPGE